MYYVNCTRDTHLYTIVGYGFGDSIEFLIQETFDRLGDMSYVT